MHHLWAVHGDRITAILLSGLIHLTAFWTGGKIFLQPAQYGVETGYGGIEIQLVAALPETSAPPEAPVVGETPPIPAGRNPEEIQIPSQETALRGPEVKPAPGKTQTAGDGSSPVPGNDPTTYYSPGGARIRNLLRSLRNPAPAYPERARQLNQEGLVVVRVQVDKRGLASRVEIKRSSGFPLLDDSAVRTIRRWKFIPAHMGPVAKESTVEIPVRFVLDNREKFGKQE
ncbi:MAG: energy transducer TonB [Candidatus Omnitrophica bacterium]|nr:energy transducer TonB [Candidatus Omnitrophota bacterium]